MPLPPLLCVCRAYAKQTTSGVAVGVPTPFGQRILNCHCVVDVRVNWTVKHRSSVTVMPAEIAVPEEHAGVVTVATPLFVRLVGVMATTRVTDADPDAPVGPVGPASPALPVGPVVPELPWSPVGPVGPVTWLSSPVGPVGPVT
jgi:hypothetical protein